MYFLILISVWNHKNIVIKAISDKDVLQYLTPDYFINASGGENADIMLREAAMVFPIFNKIIDYIHPSFQFNVLFGDYLLDHDKVQHIEKIFGCKDKLNDQNFFNSKEKLKEALEKFQSDKANPHHLYHGLYTHIFNSLGADKKLSTLEVGMGTNNPGLVSNMGAGGKPGASLRAFASFLPNSHIYGADVDKNILFQDDRINTTFADQLDSSQKVFDTLAETFHHPFFDLIIDDALHSSVASFNQLIWALQYIRKNINNNEAWIVVEDVDPDMLAQFRVLDFFLKTKHNMLKTFMWRATDVGSNKYPPYLYVIKVSK